MAKTLTPLPASREAQQPHLKQMDACEVLQQLREHDFSSREFLGRHRGLSPSRLSAAVSFLVKKGVVEKPGHGRSSAGRRPGSVRINGGYGHIIGVDIGGSNLRIALADMNGTVLGKWSTSTRKTSSPDMVIKQIRKGWKDVPLRSLLEAALRIPAAVENDVRLAAIGENWTGAARGLGNFVFLAIGTGIAAGIFANGKLVHGTDWTAGEIGYMHVPGTPEQAAKQGEPGSLESTIGGEGVRQQWLRCCNDTGVPLTRDLTATEIFEHAHAGDVLAESVLNRSAQVLAYAVYNISLVLNCALFVLGGGVGMSVPLRDATRRVLEQYCAPARPKLIISTLAQDAQLIGAIRLARNTAESCIGLKM